MTSRTVLAAAALAALALPAFSVPVLDDGTPTTDAAAADDATAPAAAPGDDAVVIAVVDSAFSPYHLDMAADLMPQHLDERTDNDLPLDTPPHEWLAGFPEPDTFGSYEEIALTQGAPGSPTQVLEDRDREQWDAFDRTQTDGDDVEYRWLSGTKVIGAVDFSGNWLGDNGSHGAKVSSVSTGTIHGSCPECLVVLVTYDSSSGARERASDWAMRQPWIDAVTNSYGYSTVLLEKVYFGASLDVSRGAVERGQQVFYSAGNGQGNAFTAPQSTYYSSQKSPDWITTVGAVEPSSGQAFMGAGKGVDIAAPGIDYPSMGGSTTNGEATFSGTSNATPVSAGIFGRSLWEVRRLLQGPSRTQADGVIAVGEPYTCALHAGCELEDGVVTRRELEDRFYAAPTRTDAGLTISQFANPVEGATTDEVELLATGFGVFFGRMENPFVPGTEFADSDRIVATMKGLTEASTPSQDTLDFMTVDSFCKQQAWGGWDQGLYTDTLPGPDPMWPVRSSLEAGCPALQSFQEFTG